MERVRGMEHPRIDAGLGQSSDGRRDGFGWLSDDFGPDVDVSTVIRESN